VISYLRRHHVALLALFLALGGGGAYAAGQLGGGQVAGFNSTPTNKSGTSKGTLAKLGGLTLTFRSEREVDARRCILVAKAGGRGELHTLVTVKPKDSALEQSVGGKDFAQAGSDEVVAASFDEGAPGVTRQVEGQLTWHSAVTHQVVTSVFHVSAESKRCAFQGTLTGAG
jgi:hypothetical protein